MTPRPRSHGTPPAKRPPGSLLARLRRSLSAAWGREINASRFGPDGDHALMAYGVTVWNVFVGVVLHVERPEPKEPA